MIKLTKLDDGKVFINPKFIIAVREKFSGEENTPTTVDTLTQVHEVRERVEQVIEMMIIEERKNE